MLWETILEDHCNGYSYFDVNEPGFELPFEGDVYTILFRGKSIASGTEQWAIRAARLFRLVYKEQKSLAARRDRAIGPIGGTENHKRTCERHFP